MQYKLDRVARKQHGVITHSQLLSSMSRSAIRTKIERGDLIPLRRGAYRLAGSPLSWHQLMVAAILVAPSGAFASHRAAGRLWRLPSCEHAELELTVPRAGSTRLANVLVHRSTALVQSGHTIDIIPVGGPERTIIELASVLRSRPLARCLDDALDRRLVTIPSLKDVLTRMGSNGRANSSALQRHFEERSGGRYEIDEVLHRRVVRWLEEAEIGGFEVEYPIFVGGRTRYIDIAWPQIKLALEVDGYAAHKSRTQFDNDRHRGNWIEVEGFHLLRVTSRTTKNELILWVSRTLARLSSQGWCS